MAGYAVGILNNVVIGQPIVTYLERIDETLAPFGGHFVVHGAEPIVKEGAHPGTVVVIEFPDVTSAAAWYDSAAYQAIVGLRTESSDSVVFLLDGVDADHRATDVLRPR